MAKKPRASQCKGRWCQTHLFSMRPRLVLSDASFQETIRFCPKFCKQKKKLERILPQLNLDGKIYTPLFILEEDRGLYASHDERNRQIFQDNRQLQEYEISQIMMPRVSSQRKYCKICKEGYEDYQDVFDCPMQHISSQEHRQALSRHPYSAFIVDLAQNFKLNQHNTTITDLPQDSCIDSEIDSLLLEKETAPRDKCNIFRREDGENDI